MSENTFNLGTVVEDAKKVITNPVGFYRDMPTEGGLSNPLIFVVVMGVATGIMISIFSLVGFGGPSMMIGGGVALAAIIMFPIMAVIGSFIGAAIFFVIWKLMGSEKNYEVAYRCVAYSMAIAPIIIIVSIIPYIGGIVKTLWGLYLLYVASTEVHQIKAETAKIVLGILAAIGIIMGISSEHTARKFTSSFERAAANANVPKVFKDLENMEDMTPEEAGKAVGELLKGMEKFGKGMEESIKAEEAAKKE